MGHFPDHWKTASVIPILKNQKINSGAPQGALLSPTLFNIFVNDIPKTRHTTICLFADDTAILAESASKACVTHFLHKHLAELEDWYKKWKIAINPTKTEAVFSKNTNTRPPAPVHVQNHPVPWSKTVKYLGVILDQHLTFNPHIVNAKKKFRALACIYSPYFTRNSPLSLKNRMLIYTSIIRSVLLYACPVWGHAARGNINILEQSQNVIIRQLTNSPWFVRNADLRFALRLKTIKATIRKIAEKFFNNLESIDNRTLRKIEIYTHDPQFNRPRNILLPPHWTGLSHPKISKYGRFDGPTSSGTSSGEIRLAVTSPYRPEFSSPAADLWTLLAKTESAGTAHLQHKQKLPAFFLIILSPLATSNS
ncbi:RNA-directed DNA polymerase from mobile element jockey [Trichonephila clavipes]|nr:RNA-directed DNA polymerase from mobile element jockey [Trichonephila clavipes]